MANPFPRIAVQPGQELAGRYRVDREIGAGAMGVVMEGWHIELDQRVAIKFLYPQFASDQEVAERFRREARAAVRIESEHVAKVLDIGTLEEGPTYYYVMEFLKGNDLARELAEKGPLPVSTAVDYVLQACDAIGKAHAHGIVHRDLKPANLFLAERPNGGRTIKVLDFGISKFSEMSSKQFSLTDTAQLMGSPAYMSPEQLESSRNVDGRADIWSLGVILHELIMGQVPFQGESVLQLVRAVLAGGRTSLTLRGDVPVLLEQIVARCLRQSRDERYADIAALVAALTPLSSDAQTRAVASSRTIAGLPIMPPSAPRAGTASLPGVSASSLPGVNAPSVPPAPGSPRAPRSERLRDSNAWGNTQRARGWRQTIYRRALPGMAGAVAVAAGVYFFGFRGVGKRPSPIGRDALAASPPSAPAVPPPPTPVPDPEASAAEPTPSSPEPATVGSTERAQEPSPRAAAPSPRATPPSVAAPAESTNRTPPSEPSAARPPKADATPIGASPSSARPSAAPPPAPRAAAVVAPRAQARPAARAQARPPAREVASAPEAREASPSSERADEITKPASGLDIPDYGGRE